MSTPRVTDRSEESATRHVLSLIRENERRFGEYAALVYEGRRFTNLELFRESRRFAAALAGAGVAPGDRVVVHVPNCPQVWVTYLACCRLGAVVVPAPSSLAAGELGFILQDSEANVVVTGSEQAEKVLGLREADPGLEHVIVADGTVAGATAYRTLLDAAHHELEGEVGTEDDLAGLIYTSGTTGPPKGVMLTHRNFWAQAVASHRIYVTPEEDARENTFLMPLSLSHIFGLYVTVASLVMGNTMVMMRRFAAEEALRLIAEHEVRIVPAVPTMLIQMLGVPDAARLARSVLQWDCGGAPLPLEVLDAVQARLGGMVCEGWGLSETTGPAANATRDLPQKKGSVGPVMRGIALEVKVVDDADREVRPRELGEFVVRGDTVMAGYWRRPDATAEAMRGGWFHTGDVGYMDEEGFAYVVDRKKDLILRGGENIAPHEVEDVLYRHPAVLEAAVVGLPDPVYGQRVVAFVVANEVATASADEVRAHCGDHLKPSKVPEEIRFLPDLPKNSAGKILKTELRTL